MLRCRSPLGALVLRAFMSPLAPGSLGVESCLRHPSLLGALVLRACCHVTVRCWEPWCEELLRYRSLFYLASLGPLGGPLGLSWGHVGPSWGVLEALRAMGVGTGLPLAVLGPFWEPLGPSWGDLGDLLGRLGTSGSRKCGNARICPKPTEKQSILPLGALLGVLLEASSGVLETS